MIVIMIVALSLSSCDWVKEVTGQKEVPLPGQRIPVMLNEEELHADPRVSDLRVLLPTPRENRIGRKLAATRRTLCTI